MFQNFTMDGNLDFNCIEKFGGGFLWSMVEIKNSFSSISHKMEKENENLV